MSHHKAHEILSQVIWVNRFYKHGKLTWDSDLTNNFKCNRADMVVICNSTAVTPFLEVG